LSVCQSNTCVFARPFSGFFVCFCSIFRVFTRLFPETPSRRGFVQAGFLRRNGQVSHFVAFCPRKVVFRSICQPMPVRLPFHAARRELHRAGSTTGVVLH
jgi:hypothetical protein